MNILTWFKAKKRSDLWIYHTPDSQSDCRDHKGFQNGYIKVFLNYFGGAQLEVNLVPRASLFFLFSKQTPHGPSNRFLNKTELNAEANVSRCFWNAKIQLFTY